MNGDLTGRWLKLLDGSLAMGATVELPVLSDSMLPVLKIGQNVKIQRARWRSCSTGDIIVFQQGRRLTAHRALFAIHAGGKCYVYQKGDSNSCGYFIRSERVVGRVVGCQDESGHHQRLRAGQGQTPTYIEMSRYLLTTLWRQVPRTLLRKIFRK